jgi:ribosomal subunit interface protein
VQTPIQITFRGLGPSSAIEDYVRRRASKLETFHHRITGCKVTVEAPNLHHKQGRQYRVRIDLVVPKAELVVGRTPDEGSSHEDVYAAIDDAFDDAGRVLQDHIERQRGYTKTHEHHRHGRVAKLFSEQGYGFIETAEGDEVYFHKNSVLREGFGRMSVGTEVRFVDEAGEQGPQASSVTVRH